MSKVPVLTWWAPFDPHPQRGIRKEQMTSSDRGLKVGFGDERNMGASEKRKKRQSQKLGRSISASASLEQHQRGQQLEPSLIRPSNSK